MANDAPANPTEAAIVAAQREVLALLHPVGVEIARRWTASEARLKRRASLSTDDLTKLYAQSTVYQMAAFRLTQMIQDLGGRTG